MDYLHCDDLIIRPFVPDDRPLVEDFFANLGEEGTFFFNGNKINEKPALEWFEGKSRENPNFLAEFFGTLLFIAFCPFLRYNK